MKKATLAFFNFFTLQHFYFTDLHLTTIESKNENLTLTTENSTEITFKLTTYTK